MLPYHIFQLYLPLFSVYVSFLDSKPSASITAIADIIIIIILHIILIQTGFQQHKYSPPTWGSIFPPLASEAHLKTETTHCIGPYWLQLEVPQLRSRSARISPLPPAPATGPAFSRTFSLLILAHSYFPLC
eukprot:GFKZ01010516.1.p1 GENE.GFKZ01010516.1~~GFKZ01010516.1.p1  ORF type:complete len:131 (+),score=6.59 GFKZ01010516.1:152-544(+)